MESIKKFVSIYEKDQVKIFGHIVAHTSCITGETYDEIEHVKITKNDTLVYEAYGNALRYPFNHGNKDMIDFKNIVDDVVFLINYNSNNQSYSSYQNKTVDEQIFLLDEILYKNSAKGDLGLKRLKREHREAMAQKEYNSIQDQNKTLIKEVDMMADSKGLYFESTYSGLCILKTIDVSYEALMQHSLKGEKQQKEVEGYIVKCFNESEYDKPEYTIYNQSNNEMLKDVIEFLRVCQNKSA